MKLALRQVTAEFILGIELLFCTDIQDDVNALSNVRSEYRYSIDLAGP